MRKRTRKPLTCAVGWCVAERATGQTVCAVHKGHHFIPDDLSAAKWKECRRCYGYGEKAVLGRNGLHICAACDGKGRVLDVADALRRRTA